MGPCPLLLPRTKTEHLLQQEQRNPQRRAISEAACHLEAQHNAGWKQMSGKEGLVGREPREQKRVPCPPSPL